VSTTTDKKTEQKHSNAVYAAAGIGDLAFEQLKKIPALAEQLRAKADQLREQGPSLRAQATEKAAELTGKVDVERIRTVLVNNAQKAAEKASAFYGDLVTRGERVVDTAPAEATVDSEAVSEPAATKPAATKPAVTAPAAAEAKPATKPAVRKPKTTPEK
jgi:heparin binding hemagglutinin HbhA